jgi:glycosyltransferase involved in cell wall biosynthesis
MAEPRRIRVLALVPYPLGTAPGQRYRMEQWAPYLDEAGIDVHFEPFAEARLGQALYDSGRYLTKAALMGRAWLASIEHAWRAARFDVVYLYREAALVGPALLERLTRWRNPRIVYDFDDAIWLRYLSPRNRYLSYFKAPGKTRTLCRLASAVTVGSEHLAQFARRYNRSVTIVPSTISLRVYRPAPSRGGSERPVVGWTGSHSSIQYLKLVEGALQELSQRRRFQLRVIGVPGFSVPGVDVESRPWRAETEVEDLWPLDVGIMPLSDDPWTAGKCAMKAIQYLGVGVPAVVSPVGSNREVIQDGVTGFHASSQDEWVRALERCLDDAALRARMGLAGRAAVAAHYSAEVQAPRLGSLLRSVAEEPSEPVRPRQHERRP